MPIRAVFFDFDGLIVDTETHEYGIWSEIFARHGTDLPLEQWSICIGTMDHHFNAVEYLSSRATVAHDPSALVLEHRERYHQAAYEADLMPGFLDRLKEARDLGWLKAIVSSSSRDWVGRHLELRGLEGAFDLIQTSEEVARTKPDPDLYLRALQKLDLAPDEAIVFEDSVNGTLAAKAAGIYTIVVPNSVTRHLRFPDPDRTVSSLADIHLSEFL